MNAPIALLAAGGTGGHVFPALALAEPLAAAGMHPLLWTDERGKAYVPKDWAHPVKTVLARRSATGAVDRLKMCPALLAASLKGTTEITPQIAVTVAFGGYPSLPGALAALLRRVPLVLHEQNAVPGLANRLLGRFATLVTTSWPNSHTHNVHVGNPVRSVFIDARRETWSPPKDADRFRILAIGGSQGAKRLTDCVARACAALPEMTRQRVELHLQCRAADQADIVPRLHGISAKLQPFFTNMAAELHAADLVICRAGSSSLAELACVGRPAILIPYPHSAHAHQDANAETFAQHGAALHLPEAALKPETLAAAITKYAEDRALAAAAAQAARALGQPDAACQLALHVIKASLTRRSREAGLAAALVSAQQHLRTSCKGYAT